LAPTHGFNGHGSEIDTDHRDHCTRYDWWHQSLDPPNAGLHDDYSYDAIQDACCNYAAKRNVQVWVWPMAGIVACRSDDGNEGEARAQVARHTPCNNYKENKSPNA